MRTKHVKMILLFDCVYDDDAEIEEEPNIDVNVIVHDSECEVKNMSAIVIRIDE